MLLNFRQNRMMALWLCLQSFTQARHRRLYSILPFGLMKKLISSFLFWLMRGIAVLLRNCRVSVPFSRFFRPVVHLKNKGMVISPCALIGLRERAFFLENAPFRVWAW
jgi:hypothetical protein